MFKQLLPLISIVIFSPNCQAVVGGSNTDIVNFPYNVQVLYYSSMHICGGTILNKNTILTSARCLDWASPSTISVRAGSSLFSGGQITNVIEIHIHPKWNSTAVDYDVAILKVKDLTFNDKVQPIGLPQPYTDVPAGTTVILTGWGVTNGSLGTLPPMLQVAYYPILDRTECIAMSRNIHIPNLYPVITERNICAFKMGVDACTNDMGDSLVWNNVLVGIMSWGMYPCGYSGFPTFYTRTSYFLDFIGQYL